MARTVWLSGNEITKFITNIPTIPKTKGERGQLTINETITLTGDNSKSMWNRSNTKSILYGKDINDFEVKIYNNDILDFKGNINNVVSNNSTAEIECRSELYKLMQMKALYISTNKTPAELCKDVLIYYGMPINGASFERSIDVHKYYSLTAQININLQQDTNMSVLDLVQQLADIGCARLYYANNMFYYEAYDSTYTPPVSVSLTITDLQSAPRTYSYEQEKIERYQITTITNVVTGGDINSDAILKQMYYSSDSPIRIITGAHYIGSSYLELSAQEKEVIEVGIDKEEGYAIDLDSGFDVTYAKLGWSNKAFEVINIDNSHPFITQVTGLSV